MEISVGTWYTEGREENKEKNMNDKPEEKEK